VAAVSWLTKHVQWKHVLPARVVVALVAALAAAVAAVAATVVVAAAAVVTAVVAVAAAVAAAAVVMAAAAAVVAATKQLPEFISNRKGALGSLFSCGINRR
jgi:hypothetical protein